MLAIIGEQFDVGQEICGAVVSIRGSEDIIRLTPNAFYLSKFRFMIFYSFSVWNKNADNLEATNKIR